MGRHVDSQNGNVLMTQMQQEHHEQDEVLDDMTTVLQRLEVMSKDIGQEIAEQDVMIEETTTMADNTYDKMVRVDKMMTKLMGDNGLTPCKVIMILPCMIVVLVILILYS